MPRALLFIIALTLTVGCGGQRHALRLGQLSTGLERFEGSPYDALVTAPVHYTTIGEPDYDKFFQEAAAVYGSMLFAIHIVERAERIVEGSVKPTRLDLKLIFTVVTETLPRTQQRAHYLYSEGHRLRSQAATTFAWKFYKLYQVRNAVDEARENLRSTKALVPELLGRLGDLQQQIMWSKAIEKSL